MNQRTTFILLISILYCIFQPDITASCQQKQDLTANDLPGFYSEDLHISTDRDIYIAGEDILMKINKLSGLTGCPDNFSKIVYVELLDTEFNPLNQVKVMVDGTSGSALLRLSDTVSTGNYFVRAYTKWMLNSTNNRDVYKPIFIVNPSKKPYNILSSTSGAGKGSKESSTLSPINSSGLSGDLKISVDAMKGSFGQRENIPVKVKVTDVKGAPLKADLYVSVVRSSLIFSEGMNSFHGYLSDTLSGSFRRPQSRLPELEGEFISGTIRNINSGDPLQNTDISLSFVGKTGRCRFSKTNYSGEFLFVVKDQAGQGDLVIQPLTNSIRDIYIELDQPFTTVFDDYSFQFPAIDTARLAGISKALIGKQVASVYDIKADRPDPSAVKANISSFYGKPGRRLKLADFIELSDIREVVKELLPEVAVYRKNKDIGLKVISRNPFEIFNNKALVLVDGVPVHDVEALLKVPSKEFEYIDIIDSKYYIKDFIFEGIVNFISVKGRDDVLEPDASVFRQIFDGEQERTLFNMPDYSSDSLKNVTIPDFRNTLYWNPDVKTTADGTASVQFCSSDEGGDFTIVISGICDDGKKGTLMVPLHIN
jgi:hypothetical protein